MPHITPPLSTIHPLTPGEHVELDVLRQLVDGLPDSFHIFHSVDLNQVRGGQDEHGELDIVVVNAAGHLAVLEVKAGVAEEKRSATGRWSASPAAMTQPASRSGPRARCISTRCAASRAAARRRWC